MPWSGHETDPEKGRAIPARAIRLDAAEIVIEEGTKTDSQALYEAIVRKPPILGAETLEIASNTFARMGRRSPLVLEQALAAQRPVEQLLVFRVLASSLGLDDAAEQQAAR